MTEYIVCYCEKCFTTISVPFYRDFHSTCDYWMELVGDFFCKCSLAKRPGIPWTRTGSWYRQQKDTHLIGLGDAVIIDLCDVEQFKVDRFEFIVEAMVL